MNKTSWLVQHLLTVFSLNPCHWASGIEQPLGGSNYLMNRN